MVLECPAPFAALTWYLENRPADLFIGNPVRHFQHLASRMSGANPGIRASRAWACFHLAEEILPQEDYPRDHQQIESEGLIIPTAAEVLKKLPLIDSSSLPVGSVLARTASVSAHSSTG